MAILDLERNAVVIRVIYDGPPGAGKTTSVRALAESLGSEVYSPREVEGHTLYFDWLDYSGGRFEGYEIRCQVVSVPGQSMLAPRRRKLIETADAAVFVSDTSTSGVTATRSYLEGLVQVVRGIPGPPVGIVVQANKRDLPGAVDLEVLRQELGAAGSDLAVVETVATSGTGVRQAFVLGVRLAMDRIRELIRTGDLPRGIPEVDSGPALLARLERLEGDMMTLSPDGPGLRDTFLAEALREPALPRRTPEPPAALVVRRTIFPGGPWLPDPTIPGERIWPPVTGRVVLHEVSALAFEPRRGQEGRDWVAKAGDVWWLHSPAESVFAEVEIGRRALIEWARLHAGSLALLSNPRAVVLAEAGDGTWRLWQIVRSFPSLRVSLQRVLALEAAGDVGAATLFKVARSLLHAAARLQTAACVLSVDLDSIGAFDGGPLYIGPMPDPARAERLDGYQPGVDREILERELGALLAPLLAERKRAIREALQPLAADPFAAPPGMVDLLIGMLAD